jgi:ParB/RepB/Spo0J family partition protein
MQTPELIGRVKHVPLSTIAPSADNPRGAVERDESFERLVSSISSVGVLVPLVVRRIRANKRGAAYELIDGERRFRAAQALALSEVPVHVLEDQSVDLRTLMFHLHMTREQWLPMAQCRSLVKAYAPLKAGLRFDEKPGWVARLASETGMSPATARDRIDVLAWPTTLKDRFFSFDEIHPRKNIYSYIVALESYVVVPSLTAFEEYYNHGLPPENRANQVRGNLLTKTISGLETGQLTSREQIREVSPLFIENLNAKLKRTAFSLFKSLANDPTFQFDDIKAEITTRLPALLEQRAPKPKRVIASMSSLIKIFESYEGRYLEENNKRVQEDFRGTLTQLIVAAKNLQKKLP